MRCDKLKVKTPERQKEKNLLNIFTCQIIKFFGPSTGCYCPTNPLDAKIQGRRLDQEELRHVEVVNEMADHEVSEELRPKVITFF